VRPYVQSINALNDSVSQIALNLFPLYRAVIYHDSCLSVVFLHFFRWTVAKMYLDLAKMMAKAGNNSYVTIGLRISILQKDFYHFFIAGNIST